MKNKKMPPPGVADRKAARSSKIRLPISIISLRKGFVNGGVSWVTN